MKAFLLVHFTIRDLGEPKDFLNIEFANQRGQLFLNQHKHVLDLL